MSTISNLTLEALPGRFAVVRLPPGAGIPSLPLSGDFLSLTITPDEISIVCAEDVAPTENATAAPGWRALRVVGELDFALTGIMAALATTLAEANVSVFAISTYNTDYLLVKTEVFAQAVIAFRGAGHTVIGA
jgi:hypothetical protein